MPRPAGPRCTFWVCTWPSSPCSGASPGMWQFWQRGCWSTARTVSKAARPSCSETAAAGEGVAENRAPLTRSAAPPNAIRRTFRRPESRSVFMASFPSAGWGTGLRQPERQPPEPLPRCGENGVGDRRRDRRHGGLADTSGLLGARDDVRFDSRHLVEPQQRVVVKIRLLDASLFEADLSVERRRQAEDDTGLHLRGHAGRIDADPAVHGADDAVYANPAVLDRHFRHLRHEAAERLVNRDTAEARLREGCSPTAFLGGQVEDAQVPRMVLEQQTPILQRVEPCGTRELVNEALYDEAGMRMADRTPPEDRDARLGGMQADPVIRIPFR